MNDKKTMESIATKLEGIGSSVPVICFQESECHYISEAMVSLLGGKKEELISLQSFIHQDEMNSFQMEMSEITRDKQGSKEIQTRFTHQLTKEAIDITLLAIYIQQGHTSIVCCFVTAFNLIPHHHEQCTSPHEQDMETAYSKLISKVTENITDDFIAIIKRGGKIEYASPSHEKHLDIPLETFYEGTAFTFIHPDDCPEVMERFSKILDLHVEQAMEFRVIHPDTKELRLIQGKGIPFKEQNGETKAVIVTRDITRQKTIEQEMLYNSFHDYLTGLPNRRFIEGQGLVYFQRMSKDFGILSAFIVDPDQFTDVNNRVGREGGDTILKEISRRLQYVSDQYEGAIGRFDEDVFVLLVYHTSSLPLKEVGKAIIKQFMEPFWYRDSSYTITCSVGISSATSDVDSFEELIMTADTAMFAAKKQGRNQYVIHNPYLDIGSFKQYELQNDIPFALKKNQLFLEFQPVLHVKTGAIHSLESLLRWRHPYWGIVSPQEFLPLAESRGLSLKLDYWVVTEVIKQLSIWNNEHHIFPIVSVNLSPTCLMQQEFFPFLLKKLNQYQIDPSHIQLELTENLSLEIELLIREPLMKLKNIGVGVVMDDFGTGAFSIGYLKSLPIQVLKMEKELIKELTSHNHTQDIVHFIIQLCNKLNIQVVGEGIENEEMLHDFLSIGGEYVQGFLFKKPLSFQQIIHLYSSSASMQEISVAKDYLIADLHHPVQALMSIEELYGKGVSIGAKHVTIVSLGEEGLWFQSDIHLPIHGSYLLRMQYEMEETTREAVGKVIAKEEVDRGFRYELQFEELIHSKRQLSRK
ncbi:EAL domain-containing protein [Pontibacillus salicampi]|uniref:EAL domain-containing protein n=1 Tax=Pontibacillus salicampi TaxID=1449801 RepID=A0ABV6LPX1_9BACI